MEELRGNRHGIPPGSIYAKWPTRVPLPGRSSPNPELQITCQMTISAFAEIVWLRWFVDSALELWLLPSEKLLLFQRVEPVISPVLDD